MMGVAIFSIIMGNFSEILEKIKQCNQEADDSEALGQFFQLMEYLNKDKPINRKLKIRIEKYFEYKWKNDKNSAIKSDED